MTCVIAPNPMTVGSDFTDADLVVESLADLDWAAFGF
jgi:hypothetical protein